MSATNYYAAVRFTVEDEDKMPQAFKDAVSLQARMAKSDSVYPDGSVDITAYLYAHFVQTLRSFLAEELDPSGPYLDVDVY